MQKPQSTDQYIESFSGVARERLIEMRALLARLAPEATEVISYGMPALRMGRILVFYAAWKSHLGFYPSGSGIRQVETLLGDWTFSKGAILFPYDRPLPVDLIEKIVAIRMVENRELQAKKKK